MATSGNTATRGLATVAMLKVNFDAGHDHISMFEPFVADAIKDRRGDALSAEDVRECVVTQHQLRLPVNTLHTLLGRLTRAGFLRREGGRYFRTEKPLSIDVQRDRTYAQKRQETLAHALRRMGEQQGVHLASDEEALGLILGFLESHHVNLAFDEPPSVDDEDVVQETASHRRTVLVASCLKQIVADGGDLAEVAQEMLEGFVLQNALLLKDISTAARQFRDLQVFADSGLLFGALGMRGPSMKVSVTELFSLLRDTGASLNVFESTIGEMRRILAIYEDKLGTSAGRLSLYPTDLTRTFLSEKWTPSDVRMRGSLIERDLRALGVTIREVPSHEPRWTLDERELGRMLSETPKDANSPRVIHDIDCVAGVLTYRRGVVSSSLDGARAVFATTSALTVRNTKRWYIEQEGRGFPPIVHYLALSNYAWLKKPASATQLKLHELVALCTAALRPTREAWQRFVEYLRSLEVSGDLSSDEVTAIVASDLTERVLSEENIDSGSDADTLAEVVERVTHSYRSAADKAVQQARAESQRSRAEAAGLRRALEVRAGRIASVMSWLLAAVLAVSFVVGTASSIITAVNGSTPSIVVLILASAPLAVAGLFTVLFGGHLVQWQNRLRELIAVRLVAWMSGVDAENATEQAHAQGSIQGSNVSRSERIPHA